jgi:integrase
MKGTVYKRGKKYSFRFDSYHKGLNKTRKQISGHGYKNYVEAEVALARAIVDDYEQNMSVSFKEICDEWILSKNKLRGSTRKSYEYMLSKYLIKEFGKKKIENLKAGDINKYYNKNLNAGMSSTYVLYMHRILNQIIKYAIINDYLDKDIMLAVDAPLRSYSEVDLLSDEELQLVLKATKSNKALYSAIFLALNTGMRRGEICSLRFSKHIDFENEVLHVKNSMSREKGNGRTKTKSSIRSIPLTPMIYEHLLSLKDEIIDDENDYVVTLGVGEKIHCDYLSKKFTDTIRDLGIDKNFRFKDLRHQHASILLKLGIQTKIIQEKLGHSRIGTTMDIYSHLLPNMQDGASEIFENEFMKKIFEGGTDSE